MFEKIILNPIFILIVIFVVMLFIIKVFFTSKNKKVEDKKTIEKKDEVKSTETEKNNKEKPKLIFKKKKNSGETNKKLKKTKEKPSISRVYEKVETKTQKQEEKQVEPEISEEELLKKMQFVKSSKTISKLVKNDVNESVQSNEVEPHMHVHEGNEPCVVEEIAKTKHGHFDKSKRLSRCIEEDNFDDMFSSHISDDYLNINVDKHLNISEKFSESLYERASKTLANSGAKVLINDDSDISKTATLRSDKDSMRAWLEDRKREELASMMIQSDTVNEDIQEIDMPLNDIQINAKSLVISQMIMNRKKISKH